MDFEGMTNGEVIKTIFPTVKEDYQNDILITVVNLDSPYPTEFYKDWWNAPYKKEEEK